jgi:polyphosphate glucokinase
METSSEGPRTLAVDIGGTGMKMLVLGATGVPITPRLRRLTPKPATPAAVIDALRAMLAEMPDFERVSVGFPGVVLRGVVQTAPNLGTPAWHEVDLERELCRVLARPVRVINDADLQGFGVIQGKGVELVLTLGTGVGAALFSDGKLVPNLELGHHPFEKDRTYEQRLCDAELDRIGKLRWNERLRRALQLLARIYNYDVCHLGGGNAKKLKLELPTNVHVFGSEAGLSGGMRLWDLEPRGASPAGDPESRPRARSA